MSSQVHANRVASHMARYFSEIEKKYELEFPTESASETFLVSLDAMAVDLRDALEKCENSSQMVKELRGHYVRFAVGCRNDKRTVRPQPTNSPQPPTTP